MRAFIDCHTHMFNIVDVPLYLAVSDRLKMGTLKRLAASLVFAANKNLVGDALRKEKEFLMFFERGIDRNIESTLKQIREHLQATPTMRDAGILLTPLVMDFDVLLQERLPEQVGQEPSVREQYGRLQEAIESTMVASIANTKVCPFVGFDLRKLKAGKFAGFRDFFNSSNTLGSGDLDSLISGKLLGIKLYPPIGFNPSPRPLPATYGEFYQWCCDEDIPITTHCQAGSFAVGADRKRIDATATPKNWQRLLQRPGLRNLRVNFAHLGGDDGIEDLYVRRRLNPKSWTYIIIRLLKDYPNTYADISAFDYDKSKHAKKLLRIFEHDEQGKFGGGNPLADKVMWGSDVPLVVSGKSFKEGGTSHYKHYIRAFIQTVKASNLDVTKQRALVRKLTEDNPKRFLRIQ